MVGARKVVIRQESSVTVSPHPEFDRILRAMKGCRVAGWNGTAYRATSKKYAFGPELIDGVGSQKHGGRWNPPGGFRVVYASLDELTALYEVVGQYRGYNIPTSQARPRPQPQVRVITPIAFQLNSVLMVNDAEIQSLLGLRADRIKQEPWKRIQNSGQEAITQAVGRAAWTLRLEGLMAPSAEDPEGVNLAVFNDHVRDFQIKILGS